MVDTITVDASCLENIWPSSLDALVTSGIPPVKSFDQIKQVSWEIAKMAYELMPLSSEITDALDALDVGDIHLVIFKNVPCSENISPETTADNVCFDKQTLCQLPLSYYLAKGKKSPAIKLGFLTGSDRKYTAETGNWFQLNSSSIDYHWDFTSFLPDKVGLNHICSKPNSVYTKFLSWNDVFRANSVLEKMDNIFEYSSVNNQYRLKEKINGTARNFSAKHMISMTESLTPMQICLQHAEMLFFDNRALIHAAYHRDIDDTRVLSAVDIAYENGYPNAIIQLPDKPEALAAWIAAERENAGLLDLRNLQAR
jgi:hypothetical protein